MSIAEALTIGEAMDRAERMHKGGWQIEEIRKYLAERGVVRSWPTIKAWANPAFRERERDRGRIKENGRWAQRTDGCLGHQHHSAAYQEARMRALLAAGVMATQVARVMAFDYPGQGWTYQRVRRLTEKRAAV